uniref:Uncharacterized protein n=1 Tax=Rhizophora mucronata TaxID=61149 RepID=A0A2P2KUP1_RHIMU
MLGLTPAELMHVLFTLFCLVGRFVVEKMKPVAKTLLKLKWLFT